MMTGILRLFHIAYNCIVRKRDDDLHAATDEQADGIVHFDDRELVIAALDTIREMQEATLHEILHIVLEEHPALRLLFRADATDAEYDHWINSMSLLLHEVFAESDWRTATGQSLIPRYGGEE